MDPSDQWSMEHYALMLLMGAEGYTVEGLHRLEASLRQEQEETCTKKDKGTK